MKKPKKEECKEEAGRIKIKSRLAVMALQVIEVLATPDFEFDENMRGEFYKWSHAILSGCEHEDWIDELKLMYASMVVDGYIND